MSFYTCLIRIWVLLRQLEGEKWPRKTMREGDTSNALTDYVKKCIRGSITNTFTSTLEDFRMVILMSHLLYIFTN